MLILAIAILLFVFGLIAETARGVPLPLDRAVMSALRNSADPSTPIGPAWLREVARDITSLGSTTVLGMVTSVIVGYQLLGHRWAVAGLITIAVLGGIALNNILKFAFARPRPNLITPPSRMYTSSFPSGHAMISAIAYLTMGALLARSYPPFPFGFGLMLLATLVTALIGVSRVYLGVHYPTDILGGWCIGGAWAIVSWLLIVWLQNGVCCKL